MHHRDKLTNFAAKINNKGLRIAVNTRLLLKNKLEGIGWVSYEYLKRITEAHPEHEFFFLFDRPYSDEFIFSNNVTPIVVSPPARHPILYYIWFELMIPRVLRKIKADVFFSPDSYLSLKTKVKSVTIFHDLNFEHRPKDVPFLARKYYQYFFPKYAHKADKIISVSGYTKQDIIDLYDISPDKIEVIYNGVNENFRPIPQEEQEVIREKYTDGKPYFVFVGAFNPRKNLPNLFKAYDQYQEEVNDDVQLVVIGEKMYWTPEIEAVYKAMKHKDKVVFTGRLPMSELVEVVGSAMIMTYVSFFEGFGIPIVEGFRAGIPVITSNTSSMPEVAGGAAYIVDPRKVEEITKAMIELRNNPDLRNEYVRKGNIRKNDFSWDKGADKVWEIIERLCSK